MKINMFQLLLWVQILLCLQAPTVLANNIYVWDMSTNTGYTNGDGTWADGSGSYFTLKSTTGTTLTTWSNSINYADDVWLGGNASTAASGTGNYTITISDSIYVNSIRQIQNGSGNYTLAGGVINFNNAAGAGLRVDRGTLTINSTLLPQYSTMNYNASTSTAVLLLQAAQTYSAGSYITGSGTVRLGNESALGAGAIVKISDGTSGAIDMNGYSVSKTLSAYSGGALVNNSTTTSTWSGQVVLQNATTFTFGGSGTLVVSGVIQTTSGYTTAPSIIKNGSGKVTFSGINTTTASLTVQSGILELASSNATAAFSQGISIQSGGTLLLAADNAISDVSNITLAGGTYIANGRYESQGTLTLTANSTIDLSTANSALYFTDSSGISWGSSVLTIYGTLGTSSDINCSYLSFGTSSGLTSAQLSQIYFASYGITGAMLDGEGYLTMIPEPTALHLLLIGVAFLIICASGKGTSFTKFARHCKIS